MSAVARSLNEEPALREIEADAPSRQSVVVYAMNFAPEIAGVGKYTGEIAEYLSASDMDVTVVTTPPHYPGWRVQPGYRNGFSRSLLGGIRVRRAPLLLRERMGGVWRLLAPLSFALSSAPIVFWEILRRRPDTVLCIEPTLFAAPVAQLAAKIVGAKTILHVQDLEVDAAFAVGHLSAHSWLKKLAFAFERLTLKRFKEVVTISGKMREKLVEKGILPSRISIIRNWVDISHIFPLDGQSPYRRELSYTDDDYIALYSGNIGAKQGLDVLLHAAELLINERGLHFIIAGDGPLKSGLQAEFGHLRNVRFMEFQPYKRLNEFLNLPDLHILPQERGAADLVLPSKLGGMLASGKPVLVTADVETELAEFVGGAATLVPPGDSRALAEAIVKMRNRGASGKLAGAGLLQVLDAKENLRRLSALIQA